MKSYSRAANQGRFQLKEMPRKANALLIMKGFSLKVQLPFSPDPLLSDIGQLNVAGTKCLGRARVADDEHR